MSYIFEALQRAEAERSGGNPAKNPESVAELLRDAEHEIAGKPSAEPADRDLPARAEPTRVDATIVKLTAAESASVASELRHEGRQKFSGPTPGAVLAGGDSAAGVARAVEPLPTGESPVMAGQARPAEENSLARGKVISPAVAANSKLVCLTDQGGLAAEKFRVLGLKLRHLRERRKLKRIVVTGTAPEEGKSLVAANLALNQSRSKVLKTLLVDGDLRRPTVATRFGFDGSLPGLSDCLRGERDLSEVVYKLSGSGLFLLPAGRAPENPLDLMQGGRLPELLERLGEFFDWIIIDTPPVIPVADTTFWMRLADGVLVVIREGVSERKVVERALDSFDRATLLGIVVNSCSDTDHKDYYSRYSQGAARTLQSTSPAEKE
jgi:capsular exopolysaccharide synthesis family protein